MPALTHRGIIGCWMVKINIKVWNLSNKFNRTDADSIRVRQTERKSVECVMTFMSSSGVIFEEVGERPPSSKIYKYDGFFLPRCSNCSKWYKWSMFLIINIPWAATSEYSAAVRLEITVRPPHIYSPAEFCRTIPLIRHKRGEKKKQNTDELCQ